MRPPKFLNPRKSEELRYRIPALDRLWGFWSAEVRTAAEAAVEEKQPAVPNLDSNFELL